MWSFPPESWEDELIFSHFLDTLEAPHGLDPTATDAYFYAAIVGLRATWQREKFLSPSKILKSLFGGK